MLCAMTNPALDTSTVDLSHDISEEEIDRGLAEYSAYITENGAFAPGDTMFAIGHYTEDRFVWFDILTVTSDDIMRECAAPEDQREKQRSLSRAFAKHFLQYYDGPEQTVPLLED